MSRNGKITACSRDVPTIGYRSLSNKQIGQPVLVLSQHPIVPGSAKRARSAVAIVPAVPLAIHGPMSARFRAVGITQLRAAAALIQALPYARARCPETLLDEQRGTCSTKHAAFVLLAQEAGILAELRMEFFEMNEANTPGVGPVLAAAGIASILEAHCRAALPKGMVDLTGLATSGAPVSVVEAIPLDVADLPRKPLLHRERLMHWGQAHHPERSLDTLWSIRERCIAALAAGGTHR